METKFKRVQEEIEVLKWHLKDDALTETGKERLKELETLMDYAHSSSQLPYKNEKLIENMCLSFRRDYGLLPKLIQEDLRRDCKNWLIAYENNKK